LSSVVTLTARVHGRVQGVDFRNFVLREASFLGLKGYVRNAEASNIVEVMAEGERPKLEQLLSKLRAGPLLARVESVQASWGVSSGVYKDFRVRY